MKRNELANCITLTRILIAPLLLWTKVFSLPFYALFLFCGITDMVDGFVARKTASESKMGALLDSFGDMIFIGIGLIKLLPVIKLPLILWLWIGMIALLRGINLLFGYVFHRRLILLHTKANKLTGLLLFLLPFLMKKFDVVSLAILISAVATFAAVQEGYFIRKNNH